MVAVPGALAASGVLKQVILVVGEPSVVPDQEMHLKWLSHMALGGGRLRLQLSWAVVRTDQLLSGRRLEHEVLVMSRAARAMAVKVPKPMEVLP